MVTLIGYLKQNLHAESDAKSLYIQIEELITDAITKEGMYKKGDKLPPSNFLAEEIGINRLTIQKAYKRLIQKGIIETHKGKGSYVLIDSFQYPKMVIKTQLTAYMTFSLGSRIKLLESERCGRSDISTCVPHSEMAASYQRLLKVHTKKKFPYAYIELFLASEVFDAQSQKFEKKLCVNAMVDVLGKDNLGNIHQIWTFRKATPDVAHHLKIAVGDPIARVHRTIHNKTNTAVYIGNLIYPASIIEFDGDWDLS